MSDPESDDDTLENAHIAGFQVDEYLEHPQELDMGINKAEEYIRMH